MEIEYKGANCITITHKKDTFVVDPKLSAVGLKDYTAASAAHLITQGEKLPEAPEGAVVIDGPGEYEVLNCSIRGIAARLHRALSDSDKSATMYRLDLDDITLITVGHIDPKLNEDQLEALGVVDVMVVPVGGNGYTLDAKSAAALVRKIEPKVVIPTHYDDEGLNYEVPQEKIDEFVKEMGVTAEVLPKLKLKPGMLPASLTVYQITRTK